jgi:hypothetical protein
MAGGWGLGYGWANAQSIAENAAIADGISVTTGGSILVKGSWQQLNSSLSYDVNMLMVTINSFLSLGNIAAFDIATGASGSELMLVNNVLQYSEGMDVGRYVFPFCVPQGTRVAARCSTNYAGADAADIAISGWDTGFNNSLSSSAVDVNAFQGGYYAGVSVDPGGTANTKSSWVTIISSASFDYKGIILQFDQAYDLPTGSSIAWYNALLDVGMGASGSEKVVISNFPLREQTYHGCGWGPPNTINIPINIAAGTRVAMRLASQNTTATYRILGVSTQNVRG